MKSAEHKKHIATRMSHNNCGECRADCERQWIAFRPFKYAHVAKYLSYVKPRIEAIRAGENSVNAAIWHRDFLKALNNRISSHVKVAGRKHCHSYLERLGMALGGRNPNAAYLRHFAAKGASAL